MTKELRPNEYWLEPVEGQGQNSFWKRAKVIKDGNFTLLKSYDTIVCGIKRKADGGRTFYRFWDGYSATSMKHINAFMDHMGWKNEESRGKDWWVNSELYDYSDVCREVQYKENGEFKPIDYDLDNYSENNFLNDYDTIFRLNQYDDKSRELILNEVLDTIKKNNIKDSVCYVSLKVYANRNGNPYNVRRMLAFLESKVA